MKLYILFVAHGINLSFTEDISDHFISQVWNSMYLTHEINVSLKNELTFLNENQL